MMTYRREKFLKLYRTFVCLNFSFLEFVNVILMTEKGAKSETLNLMILSVIEPLNLIICRKEKYIV